MYFFVDVADTASRHETKLQIPLLIQFRIPRRHESVYRLWPKCCLTDYEQSQFSMYGAHCIIKECLSFLSSYSTQVWMWLNMKQMMTTEQYRIVGFCSEWFWYITAQRTCILEHVAWRLFSEFRSGGCQWGLLYKSLRHSPFLNNPLLTFLFIFLIYTVRINQNSLSMYFRPIRIIQFCGSVLRYSPTLVS